MLKFLYSCCKYEKLKQFWASERDYHGGYVNQQILDKFNKSVDPNISEFLGLSDKSNVCFQAQSA